MPVLELTGRTRNRDRSALGFDGASTWNATSHNCARSPVAARLSSLIEGLDGAVLTGTDCAVIDATHDSRQVVPGALFCAVPGQALDGHDFAADAGAAGAAACLVERPLALDLPQIVVPSVREAMGPIAARIHGSPSSELRMLGVTGTNGKTTVTCFLEAAMAAAGWGSSRIGTLGSRLHGRNEGFPRTTPEATDLQRMLRSLRTRGADGVAMEVSSHGLDLHRVDGIVFDVAAFTNLTQDHLDWHLTIERYRAAKARLFTPELSRHAVLLLDAPGTREMLPLVDVPLTTIGTTTDADVHVRERLVHADGSQVRFELDGIDLHATTVMRGAHNLDNLLVAIVTAVRAGIDAETVISALASVPAPEGRMEPFGGGDAPLVLVDYAHTPDAITAAVSVGRSLLSGNASLHAVLGAGGDRDRDKRALMGEAAANADHVIITDDNPRSEDPDAIRAAILAGARGGAATIVDCGDRASAIQQAIMNAEAHDVVLVLGRGHEMHQEVRGEFRPLDDRQIVRDALDRRGQVARECAE